MFFNELPKTIGCEDGFELPLQYVRAYFCPKQDAIVHVMKYVADEGVRYEAYEYRFVAVPRGFVYLSPDQY